MNKSFFYINTQKISTSWFVVFLAAGLGGLVCLLPIVGWFDYDRKRFSEVLLIVYMLIGLASFQSVQQNVINVFYRFKRPIKTILLMMLFLSFLSIYFSYEKESAFIEGVTLISLALMVVICSTVWLAYPKLLYCLIIGVFFSILILEVQFITYYIAHLVIRDTLVAGNFFPSFENVRFFNQFQIWLLPFFSFISLFEHKLLNKNRLRIVIWFAGIVWWVMFFTTGGRGVIVSTLGVTLILSLVYGRLSLIFLKRTFLMIIVGYIVYQLMFRIIPWFLFDSNMIDAISAIRSGSSFRMEYLWPIAIDLIWKNPLIGVGPMHYAWFTNEVAAHPHNSVLQIAAEWGVPNLMACLFLIFLGVRNWLNRFNKKTLDVNESNFVYIILGLSFSVANAMIYSLFCGVIVMPVSHLTGVLIISLMLAFYRGNSYDSSLSFGKPNIFIYLVISCVTITYCFFVFQDGLPRLLEPGYLPEIDLNVNGPRFWMIGDISK